MPNVEKKRSSVDNDTAKTTPHKKPAYAAALGAAVSMVRIPGSASPTPPSSPGAEQRAKEEWRRRHAALKARIEAEQAEVLAGLQQLKKLRQDLGCAQQAAADADNLLAYDELRQYGVDNVLQTVEQPMFIDSSSEDSDAESDSAESIAY